MTTVSLLYPTVAHSSLSVSHIHVFLSYHTYSNIDVYIYIHVIYMYLYMYIIGVNISERKSGTERTKKRKKRKKRELVFFPPPGGATGIVIHRLDATRILPELRWRNLFMLGPTWPGLSQNRQNTHHFTWRISFAEHWKLVAESSEFHLTLSRADFFHLEICKIGGTF